MKKRDRHEVVQPLHVAALAEEETHACAGCSRRAKAIDILEVDLQNAEIALRAERRQTNLLRGQLNKLLDEGAESDDVNKVFNIWRGACNHPRARLLADRKKAISRMIKHYGVGDCVLAVLGAAESAYTNPKNGVRYDGIDNIFKNEDRFERFRDAGRRACSSELRAKRLGTEAARELERAGMDYVEDDAMQVFYFKCPVCRAEGKELDYFPLIVRFDGKHGYCRECWTDLAKILEELTSGPIQRELKVAA